MEKLISKDDEEEISLVSEPFIDSFSFSSTYFVGKGTALNCVDELISLSFNNTSLTFITFDDEVLYNLSLVMLNLVKEFNRSLSPKSRDWSKSPFFCFLLTLQKRSVDDKDDCVGVIPLQEQGGNKTEVRESLLKKKLFARFMQKS